MLPFRVNDTGHGHLLKEATLMPATKIETGIQIELKRLQLQPTPQAPSRQIASLPKASTEATRSCRISSSCPHDNRRANSEGLISWQARALGAETRLVGRKALYLMLRLVAL